MDTTAAVDAYIAQAQARYLSPKTVESYRWGLSYISAPCLPDSPEHIEEILARAGRRLAKESLYDLWRCLRTFHRWAGVRYGIPDPTVHVAAPRRAALLPRALSPAHVQALLGSCRGQRDRLLILVPLDTGLRLSEVAAMRQDSVNSTVRVIGKGNKARHVPISPGLAKELRGIGDLAYVWTTGKGTPMSADGLKTAYRRVFKRAAVRGGPHSLRHTFATEYLRGGGDIYRLSRILGHSTTRVTERYLHLIVDDLLEEHSRISPALPYLATGDTPPRLP